ncbi:hypothetical protein ACFXPY_44790 [Streptomyces sp. NPDC059153]|uniref:hypothetical protein n=1 Tax=Streptomyces sp. NPDC059153 TaxID=3346743 RepID=UPI0036790FF5
MLDPTAFTCRVLAQQLAAEWVEYVEATSRRVGTATGYRQAVTLLCRFVDDTLQGGASAASLAEADPDISDVLLAWEHSLPSQRPVGSTRPGTLASLVRTLISGASSILTGLLTTGSAGWQRISTDCTGAPTRNWTSTPTRTKPP